MTLLEQQEVQFAGMQSKLFQWRLSHSEQLVMEFLEKERQRERTDRLNELQMQTRMDVLREEYAYQNQREQALVHAELRANFREHCRAYDEENNVARWRIGCERMRKQLLEEVEDVKIEMRLEANGPVIEEQQFRIRHLREEMGSLTDECPL